MSLKFKDYKDGKVKGDKEVTAQIYLDEAHSVTVPQKSLLEEKQSSITKGIMLNLSRIIAKAQSSHQFIHQFLSVRLLRAYTKLKKTDGATTIHSSNCVYTLF